jgi:hypothetical protein
LLVAALRRAHEAELTAVGERRRPAFRLTRSLLGGARAAGYPAGLLASCLGVSVGSVRTRGSDGWIPAAAFAELAGLAIGDIHDWVRRGQLTETRAGAAGEDLYLASDLVRALTAST